MEFVAIFVFTNLSMFHTSPKELQKAVDEFVEYYNDKIIKSKND